MNPKDLAALGRVPLHLIPAAGRIHGALACLDGAYVKGYGPYNWREKPISYMGYLGAISRHVDCLIDREEIAHDSGVHHLGHINATTAILLDAALHGTLIDDRPAVPSAENCNARLLEQLKKHCEQRREQIAKRESGST